MPCNSDHMIPTAQEALSAETAQLIVYVYEAQDKPVPKHILKTAQDQYGDISRLDKHVALLCKLIRGMTPDQQAEIVFDGRRPKARRLADWWDRHQAADRRRKQEVKEAAEQRALRASGLAKLTSEEIEALGIRR